MKLINEIIDILSNDNPSLETALLKTKVLLSKMGEKSLSSWVDNELRGYRNEEVLPEYRTVTTRVYGDVTNGHTTWKNYQLPILHLEKDIRNQLSTVTFYESISALEHLSQSEGTLAHPIQTEFCSLFKKGLASGLQVESAYQQISQAQIVDILTQIRSRLLDFILELSNKFPEEITDENIKSKSKEIDTKELFNNAIFGDNATIIVGDNNSSQNNQIKNNFDELIKILQSYNLTFEDLKELDNSINKDKDLIDDKKQEIGEHVQNWIQRISSKVGDKLAVENIIEHINDFYGWLT